MARGITLQNVRRAQNALSQNLRPLFGQTVPQPHGGWISATRTALGMSRAQLATRMGVTRARIAQLEQSEQDRVIKLDTLRRAAEALNCTLVYAFVPTDSYDNIVKEQARLADSERIARVLQTMRLENQAVEARSISVNPSPERELVESGRLWNC